jgi:hypothetical protein
MLAENIQFLIMTCKDDKSNEVVEILTANRLVARDLFALRQNARRNKYDTW